ncbi:MAG TPA: hypothetical protein VN238_18460 [Solirubrobacteraceae bacterium]|nr:hypothetical protein [Solirubrobacteraceae bacterium]
MRFLFLTLYGREPEFYGRVGVHLREQGHDVAHVTWSRRGATTLRKMGLQAWCLADLVPGAADGVDLADETRRLETTYDMLSLRDVYRTDPPVRDASEEASLRWAIAHFRALERIFDEWPPDVVVPEVGSETMRTAAHLIGLERGIDVLFLFYTIFPNPLRLYANTMHAPIVTDEELRPLEPAEQAEVDAFVERFVAKNQPIRAYRQPRVHGATLRDFAWHIGNKATTDRDNPYLHPQRFVTNYAREKGRAALARRLYEPLDASDRPFVYFPLHVTDDYKIKRVIPHCVDQASIIELVAEFLPEGIDLVLKEHPMSIGRNGLALLRRLSAKRNIRLVDPYTSSHELIRRSQAVAVISSTVGLEALLHGHPVMTVGQPFYGGYGVTVDVDSFREIPEKVQELLAFRPDRERIDRFVHACMRRCYPGKPVLVDPSPENARTLAGSLHAAVTDDPVRPSLLAR